MSTFHTPLNPPFDGGLNPPFKLWLNPPFKSALNPPFKSRLDPPFDATANPPFGTPSDPPFERGLPRDLGNGAPPGGYGWPWFGVQPAWAGEGDAGALRALALAQVRTRIVAPPDPRDAPVEPVARGSRRAPARVRLPTLERDALWRWQAPYRIKAVVAELLGRCVVWSYPEGACLWWALPTSAYPVAGIARLGPRFGRTTQIDKVLRAAIEREERLPEILIQADDPGCFFDAITGIERRAAPRLDELLQVAWDVGHHVVMAFKNTLAERRPVEWNARVMPVIETPGHGTLPSGHAMNGALTSELLSALMYDRDAERRRQLDLLARRIAFNRVVAGVHFPMDSLAGYWLGRRLAAMLVAAARRGRLPEGATLRIQPTDELVEMPLRDEPSPPRPLAPSAVRADHAAGWRTLWAAARAEYLLLRR
jgi:hypothetical protein